MSSKLPRTGRTALSRRDFTAFALGGAASMLATPSIATATPAAPRFASADHGLAQTVITLGAPLVGLAQKSTWPLWTIEPPVPAETANLGIARELNLELLQRLAPDIILSTPYLEGVRHLYEKVAPVESFPIHALGTSPYPNILEATRRLGALSGREREAETLIRRTEEEFAAARPKLAGLRRHKLVFLHFVDTRHVRIYGPNCIIQDVLDRLELENGWPHPSNGWGFATAGIERLVDIGDAWVFVFDPVPPDAEALLAESPLWRNLPFVRAGRIRRFGNVLAFGTLPAARRMTRLLQEVALDDA